MDTKYVMEYYPFMKECLKKFNYPNIDGLDDENIANIFSTANRKFLVSWLFKQIDDGYSDFVETASNEELADLLHCNGFCADSEKNIFMNGDCDSAVQFRVLYKIFKFAASLHDTEPTEEGAFSLTEVKDLLDFDTNLFPMYGNKHVLNSTERENKIKDYQKEIEELNSLIESKTTTAPKNTPLVEANLKEQIFRAMGKLEINFPDFKQQVLDIMKQNGAKTEQINFDENFMEMLKTCNADAEIVLNFMKNLNVVGNFKKNSNMEREVLNYDTRSLQMLRELSELCNEINNLDDI